MIEYGNAVYGPFKTPQQAAAWAKREFVEYANWKIAVLRSPKAAREASLLRKSGLG